MKSIIAINAVSLQRIVRGNELLFALFIFQLFTEVSDSKCTYVLKHAINAKKLLCLGYLKILHMVCGSKHMLSLPE